MNEIPLESESINEVVENSKVMDEVLNQSFADETQNTFIDGLEDFFQSYLVDTPDGFLQIFQSFTYGEMVISFLLLLLVMLYAFKWIWEVLR